MYCVLMYTYCAVTTKKFKNHKSQCFFLVEYKQMFTVFLCFKRDQIKHHEAPPHAWVLLFTLMDSLARFSASLEAALLLNSSLFIRPASVTWPTSILVSNSVGTAKSPVWGCFTNLMAGNLSLIHLFRSLSVRSSFVGWTLHWAIQSLRLDKEFTWHRGVRNWFLISYKKSTPSGMTESFYGW